MKIHRLKIGNNFWRVSYRQNPKLENTPVDGFIDDDLKVIVIRKTQSERDQEETLLHELIHIVGDPLYFFEEKKDHDKFNTFTDSLYTVLKENALLNL